MKNRLENIFEFSEHVLYGIVGFFLVFTAVLIIYGIIEYTITHIFTGEIEAGAIHIIDKMLLALMVAEILNTIRSSFKSHSLVAEPFLIVGLIAIIRRILVISVESAHVIGISAETFYKYMLELGILGGLTIIIVVSIYILRRKPRAEIKTKEIP